MTAYEILTLVVAGLAAIAGIVSIVRTQRFEKRQLELQETAARLDTWHLESLENERRAKEKADVMVELVKVERDQFRFVISNQGHSPAYNVNFRIVDAGPRSPLVTAECDEKLPYPKLEPEQSFRLFASIMMGSPMTYTTHVSWQNPDRTLGDRTVHVAM